MRLHPPQLFTQFLPSYSLLSHSPPSFSSPSHSPSLHTSPSHSLPSHSLPSLFLLSLSLLLLFLLAACGQQQLRDDLPPPPTINDTTTVVQVQHKATTPTPEDDSVTLEKNATPELTPEEEFAALLKRSEGRTYTVTYLTRDPLGSGTLTVYQQGKSTRVDVLTHAKGLTFESRQYTLPDGMIFCGKNETWHCLKVPPPTGNATLPTLPDQTANLSFQNLTPPRLVRSGQRTLLNFKLQCFTSSLPNVTTEQCFTKDGILLYLDSRIPVGEVTWQATDYEPRVPPGVFTPPATPEAMPEVIPEFTTPPTP